LIAAVKTKLKKLDSEFSNLRSRTKHLTWLSPLWWGAETGTSEFTVNDSKDAVPNGMIQFDDWAILDAMYRSRALEFPTGAEAMIPAIDIANHDASPVARFEVEENGDAVLLLETSSVLHEGEEICINYGSHKSTLEFIFTYGFLPHRTNADSESILLSLPPPEDDPLLVPKVNIVSASDCIPAIKISDHDGSIKWDSEVLFLMNLNEEDGLNFSVSGESGTELHLVWKGELIHLRDLRSRLEQDEMWDLFLLRAVVTILTQVEKQLLYLRAWKEDETEFFPKYSSERLHNVKRMAIDFQAIEEGILSRALSHLGAEVSLQHHFSRRLRTDSLQKLRLIQSSVVLQYFNGLREHNDPLEEEEDNSFA
jgi:hypothetical protein